MKLLATLGCGLALATGATACGSSGNDGTTPATSVSSIPDEDVRKETQTQSLGSSAKPALHPDTSNSVGSGGMGN
jgi:hypothetical protein